jgi:hypothetical protein
MSDNGGSMEGSPKRRSPPTGGFRKYSWEGAIYIKDATLKTKKKEVFLSF